MQVHGVRMAQEGSKNSIGLVEVYKSELGLNPFEGGVLQIPHSHHKQELQLSLL